MSIGRMSWPRGRIAGAVVACLCFGVAFVIGSGGRAEPVPPAAPVAAAPTAATPPVTGLGEVGAIPRLRQERPAPAAEPEPRPVTPPGSEEPPIPQGETTPPESVPDIPIPPAQTDPAPTTPPQTEQPPEPVPPDGGGQPNGGGESTFGGG